TFAWFESYRRLSKDFEYRTDTSEAMIQFAMIKLMLNRIKK
ncbi:MAG TPA: IS5/IS1182 family transposase, partial [Prolixibacteraceae bacterium]|nr:IS5/IS1182 family transposase [Prolixibacteraceae bacterium]HZL10070.1 IS5/IS1182 family transposase [Prolixibacteraceae bacterium]HZL11490.1 IS5/IS1182 family transposase [Prolixibacteraceae bacterium]